MDMFGNGRTSGSSDFPHMYVLCPELGKKLASHDPLPTPNALSCISQPIPEVEDPG